MAIINKRVKVATVETTVELLNSVSNVAKAINSGSNYLANKIGVYSDLAQAERDYLNKGDTLDKLAKLVIDNWVKELEDEVEDSKQSTKTTTP